MIERKTLTVTEAAQVLGISRDAVYQAVKTGALPALRLGLRRIVIPRAQLERLLNEPPSENAS